MFNLEKEVKKETGMGGKIIIKKKCPHKDFENKLGLIRDFVEGLNIKVYNGENDGRDVSKQKEFLVVNPILDNFEWTSPKRSNRDYADCYVRVVGGYSFPVNVKLLAKLNSSFNNVAGSVGVMSDLLYGEKFSNYKGLAKALLDKKPFTTTPKQYGMVIVNKTDSSVSVRTLFNINKADLIVNPSNGLQFRLSNKDNTDRTQATGQRFLVGLLRELLKKQAAPYLLLTGQGEEL